METVRDNTGESNPADLFAAHNEEVQLNLQKELLNEKLAKNEDLKKEIIHEWVWMKLRESITVKRIRIKTS